MKELKPGIAHLVNNLWLKRKPALQDEYDNVYKNIKMKTKLTPIPLVLRYSHGGSHSMCCC